MNTDSLLSLISTLWAQLNQAQARIAELEQAVAKAPTPPKD